MCQCVFTVHRRCSPQKHYILQEKKWQPEELKSYNHNTKRQKHTDIHVHKQLERQNNKRSSKIHHDNAAITE
uniref:Uncharacterized protein n=1 Tax=Arundo donax TaxID=35708 RepID=A0A0A9AWY6_ARUDO